MKKRLSIVLTVVFTLCFTSVPKQSRALFSDAALLSQQILQYLQDLDSYTNTYYNFTYLINDIENRQFSLQSLRSLLPGSVNPNDKFGKISQANATVIATLAEMNCFIKFIAANGNPRSVQQAFFLFTSYKNRTKSLVSSLGSLFSVLGAMRDPNGADYIQAHQKVQDDYAEQTKLISDAARARMAELVVETLAYQEQVKNARGINRPLI